MTRALWAWLPSTHDVSSRGQASFGHAWLGQARLGTARHDSAGLPLLASSVGAWSARPGWVRHGWARRGGAGLGSAPLFSACCGVAGRGASGPGGSRLGVVRLGFPGLGKASPFEKRKRINEQLVERIRQYTFGDSPVTARKLEDVHDHLLLATAAIDSGDEDTAAREIKSARSLMRAAVEEMRA